jgi:hypothetical protein
MHAAADDVVTPGEFEVEASLDPVHEALDDLTIAEPDEPEPVPLFAAVADEADDRERFTDDFADEQEAEPDLRSPLEAPPPGPEEAPMFRSVEPEPDLHDVEHGRPAVLPFAVVGVLGMLVGFGGGYFVGSRDRLTPAAETTQTSVTTPSSKAAPARAATSQTPGQYSEQKVTEPAPAPPPDTRPSAAASPAATKRTAAPAAAAATRGEIVVKSLPAHAGVTINGTWRGRTPLTLQNLAFGTYTVRVVQPGYNVAREEVTLSAQAPSRSITTRLERAAPAATKAAPAPAAPESPASFSGSLYVDSRPRGARVSVDGKSVGQTPLSVPEVRAGTHVVRIEMDGKKPVTATPRIVAGKTERVTVSLEDKQ